MQADAMQFTRCACSTRLGASRFELLLNALAITPFFNTTLIAMPGLPLYKKAVTEHNYFYSLPEDVTVDRHLSRDEEFQSHQRHFTTFHRQLLPSKRKSSASVSRLRYSRNLDDSEESGDSLSSLSSLESDDEDHEKHSPELSSIPKEEFGIGDVVYIASNLAHPHLGVITDVFVSDVDEDEDGRDRGAEGSQDAEFRPSTDSTRAILCTIRFLYWPQDVSQVTSKKLTGLIEEVRSHTMRKEVTTDFALKNEVYYTHQAPRLGRRRTKNSLRGSHEASDNFEYGPSLLFMTTAVSNIIGRVNVYPSPQAYKEAAEHEKKMKVPQKSIIFKRKKFPRHLFLQRAIDPQKELFWNIDWMNVTHRGKTAGKWDLMEGDDEIRGMGDREQTSSVSVDDKRSPLSTPGRNASDWAKALAKQKGISYTDPKDRDSIRRKREAQYIASIFETPSKRYSKKRGGTSGRTRKAFRNTFADNLSESEDDAASSSDDDDDSTAFTSDDDFVYRRDLSDEEEEMLSMDEDDFDRSITARFSVHGKKRKRKTISSAPVTPSKQRLLSSMGSPIKAMITPRSKARILGTVTQAPTSLPARPPPLTTLSSHELVDMTPQSRAKRLLHVGATPEALPCRGEQYEEVMACLEDAVEEGIGGCLYVSGVPGTGKTATVREVIRSLQCRAETNEVNPFNFVEINGMKLQDPHDAYGVLWHALTGMRCSNSIALHHLGQHYGARRAHGGMPAASSAGPGRATTIVLMDELDQLVTTRQDVMYNMFNWPNGLDSRLVVVAVANTMDLPERVLHPKVASRLGMTRITFKPYNDRQLVEIVQARLGMGESANTSRSAATYGCENIFTQDALVYLAKRVSNVSGDARRMLDVSRRAIDLVEEAKDGARSIGITDVKRVLDIMVKSGKGAHISRLCLQAKIALVATLAAVRRHGTAEVDVGAIVAAHRSLCRVHALSLPAPRTCATISPDDVDDVGQISSMSCLLDHLCSLGLVIAVGNGTAGARSGCFARYMVSCSHDEVRLALEQDEDTRIRSML